MTGAWILCPYKEEGITIGPFSRMSVGGADTGQTVGGEGWYRKEFTIQPEDADKIISLYLKELITRQKSG